MMRRLIRLVGLGLLCLNVITACSGPPPTVPAPHVPAAQGTSIAAARLITATAKVVPADIAHLSFVISATVEQVAVTEGASVRAGQPLITLSSPELSFAEQAAVAALNSALADEYIQSSGRRKWDGFKFVWVAGPPEQRQVARARVLQAQAALEAARAELAQATLAAPFDGTVVSLNVSEGEPVRAGQIAVVIGNLARLQVETTDLSERQIAGVRIGQKARVHLKAIPTELGGVVRLIAPLAGISPDGDTIFKVTIELDSQDPALLWGMTGDAELETQ